MEAQREAGQLVPDQVSMQTNQAHALGLPAALQVLHRISQIYDNGEQNLCPNLYATELAQRDS